MFDRNLISNKYLNPNDYLDSFKVNFLNAKPFPSIVIKDFVEISDFTSHSRDKINNEIELTRKCLTYNVL